MKKLFLFWGISFLLISLSILACSEEENLKCESCESSFILETINFYGKKFESKRFDDKVANNSYYHISTNSIYELENFNNSVLNNLNLEKTNCLVVINKNEEKVNDNNVTLSKESIIFLYEKESNYFNVKIFIKNNNGFNESKKYSNYKSSSLITNDLHNLAKIILKSSSYKIYTFMSKDFEGYNKENNELNFIINKELSLLRMSSSDKCSSPCPSFEGNDCKNNGTFYFCGTKSSGGGGNSCGKNVLQQNLELNRVNNYNYSSIDKDLKDFKNVYLSNNSGGERIINDYYLLSSELPLNSFSLEHSINTFDLIISDIIPITNSLIQNPNGSEILINNNTKSKLTQYLYEIKDLYSNVYAKERIQNLINKLDYFSNKSNNFVTNNLSNY